jgi:hypothetical protein
MRLNELANEKYKVFVDMDGVIADFDKLAKKLVGIENVMVSIGGDPKLKKELWKKVKEYQRTGGKMWGDLEMMPDAKILWAYLEKLHAGGLIDYPQILSATGQPNFGAEEQKREWIRQHFGHHIKVILTQTAREKANYACERCILIDDRTKAIDPWTAAGGVGIMHTSARNTINLLNDLLKK